MNRFRRWLVKALIGKRMVVANMVQDKIGALRPRYGVSGALVFGSLFRSLEPRLYFEPMGRNRLQRWLVKRAARVVFTHMARNSVALEFELADEALVEDCAFLGPVMRFL